jgi:integrase
MGAMLTKLALDAITQPGRYLVGGVPGLYLQVTIGKAGAVNRSFVFRYKFAGKTREAGLGSYPAIRLGEARDRAREGAALKAKGIDPLAAKAKAKAAEKVGTQTFSEAVEAYLKHSIAEKTAKDKNSKFGGATVRSWRSVLRRYAAPVIGKLNVVDVTHSHVASILKPLVIENPTVAFRLRSRIETVLEFSAATGYRSPESPNPARASLFKTLLGSAPPTTHFAAPPLGEAPELYRRIRDTGGTIYRAAEFMILTCCRIREALDATWAEIDLAEKTWTIGAERSKMGRAHVVPLSDAAVKVIERAAAWRASDKYIFPGRYNSPFSSTAMAPALARIGVGYSRHGWRSV